MSILPPQMTPMYFFLAMSSSLVNVFSHSSLIGGRNSAREMWLAILSPMATRPAAVRPRHKTKMESVSP
uniref:Uncharacterized protein n=3 Tax=Human herpesvirus 2 TaxID=10310 RepID=A0A481TX97_HHV2|nr:hypothetical protein [Human alphaherpesvirus 2]